MGEKKRTVIKVRNHHVDAYGHVNNATYFNYLEDARTDFFEELGYSLEVLAERKVRVYLTEVTAHYRHPAQVNDLLEIYGWFIKISNRRATWQHEIYNLKTGRLVLTGTATGMFTVNGRLARIPEDMQAAMRRLYIPPRLT